MDIQNARFDKDGMIVATVDGKEMSISAVEGNRHYDELTRQAITPTAYVFTPTVEDVKTEAERRINAGTLINGVQFKCDTASIARLIGMKDGPAELFPVTFKTDAGQTVTVNNATEAQALFDAATLYVGLILAKSATLQAMAPIPADYAANETYWS